MNINRPRNKEEIFNLRHSQLRNVIERTFGSLKRRFAILQGQPEYPMVSQVKLVVVLAGLHNFIRKESSEAERYIHCPAESGMYFCNITSCFYYQVFRLN